MGIPPHGLRVVPLLVRNLKPNKISYNTVKYQRIDTTLRAQKRRDWNHTVLWPLGLLGVLLAAFTAPAVIAYFRRERQAARA